MYPASHASLLHSAGSDGFRLIDHWVRMHLLIDRNHKDRGAIANDELSPSSGSRILKQKEKKKKKKQVETTQWYVSVRLNCQS